MNKEKELQEAWEKAYSIESRDPEEDGHENLIFIGIVQSGAQPGRNYLFYKGEETGNYWYESKKMADTSGDIPAGSQKMAYQQPKNSIPSTGWKVKEKQAI